MNDSLDRSSPQPLVYAYPPMERDDDEIDLLELWSILWQGKWTILGITALFAVGAAWYAVSQPNIYQSRALLAPSEEAQAGGAGRMMGQFGGLASLAGVSLPGGRGVDKVAVAIEVLKSRQFITEFIHRHEILPELMAVEGWSWVENKIGYDRSIYDPEQQLWVREVNPPRTVKPSNAEAYKKFMESYSVSQDRDTGFVSLSVEHLSPYVATRWASLLVRDLNNYMKQQDVQEAQRSIDYLQKQLAGTALADMRRIFYQLIEEQTKIIMLAAVRDEYVFSTIDPAVVPEEKIRPRRALICMLGTLLGGMLAVVFVFIRHFVRSSKATDEHTMLSLESS